MMIRLQDLADQHGAASEVVHRTYTAMIDAFIDLELQEHALGNE